MPLIYTFQSPGLLRAFKPSQTPLTIRGAVDQTAPLLVVEDSSGKRVLEVDASGSILGIDNIDISPRARTFTVDCDPSLVPGDLVYLPSVGLAVRANAQDASYMPSAGMVIGKPSDGVAIVQVNGLVEGVFSDLIRGAVYYVGIDGQVSNGPPQAAQGTKMLSQRVGIAASSNQLILMISPDVYVFYR